MLHVSLPTAILLGFSRIVHVASDAIPSSPTVIPSTMKCPSSGILHLKAGEYAAWDPSLGKCTVIGEAPGAVIYGKITFDHGMLKGFIHFKGDGITPTCVEGPVEVNGDDVRFHGCSHSSLQENSVNVSGGMVRFENTGRLCGLTIVAGSVNISNSHSPEQQTGCTGTMYGSTLAVGPGPVHLNIDANLGYRRIFIDGMKGRLGGAWATEMGVTISNSIVEFNNLSVDTAFSWESLLLNRVIGSGTVSYNGRDHNIAPIYNCVFKDMVYSGYVGRGSAQISNTTWTGGSFGFVSSLRSFDNALTVHNSSLHDVSVSGYIPTAAAIISSNVSGKVGLTMDYSAPLRIMKSQVVFLPASSTSWSTSRAGLINISSSTLSFPGSSGSLVGASQLDVTSSTIHVTNVSNGSPIQIGGDIHMSDVNIDVTNCSASWVSQSFVKTGQTFFEQPGLDAQMHNPLFV